MSFGSSAAAGCPVAFATAISSSIVKLVRPCHLRVNAEVEIPDFADSSACVRLARAVAALTSAATASLSLVSLIQVSYSYNGTDATLLCCVSLFRYAWGMTRTPLAGPATAYIAGELRAQRARKGWTLDDLEALTGAASSMRQCHVRSMTGGSDTYRKPPFFYCVTMHATPQNNPF